MSTMTAADIRGILENLDRIEELTGLLRRAHFDVPYHTVYDAVGAASNIRKNILRAALRDVEVETLEPTVVA